ncbi:MAG: hypothetical protein ACTHN0_06840 [Aquihabitans sp.]
MTIDGNSARRLRHWILSQRMSWTTEDDLQRVIAHRLDHEVTIGSPINHYVREVRVDERNRLDFVVQIAGDVVGVEVKIAGSRRDVLRQLTRYAQLDQIDELLLVTTKANHHRMPTHINGKPVLLCSLVEAGL